MKHNTYALARPHPNGISVTDAITISGNRRRPIRFEQVGDAVDLMAVDVETFARSAYSGLLRHLFLSGVVMAVSVEVPEPRATELLAAFGRLQENGGHATGLAGDPMTIQLEPGVQVGVHGIPDRETMLPDLPQEPAAGTVGRQFEPGSFIGSAAPAVAPTQETAPEQKPGKKGKKGKKDPASAQATAQSGFEGWKNNIDFQTQKTRIAESTDKDFLSWVSTNDDSRQLQKIASARLAEIDRAN